MLARILYIFLIIGWSQTAQAATVSVYWNLFNEEGDSTITAVYTTFATLLDMLTDTNRTGFSIPDGKGFGKNVVGSGSWIYTTDDPISPVPLPAGLPLLLSGLGLLAAARMNRQRQT